MIHERTSIENRTNGLPVTIEKVARFSSLRDSFVINLILNSPHQRIKRFLKSFGFVESTHPLHTQLTNQIQFDSIRFFFCTMHFECSFLPFQGLLLFINELFS